MASAEDEGHVTLRGVLSCLSYSAGRLESPHICFTGVLSGRDMETGMVGEAENDSGSPNCRKAV
jgi:hypothetical protein